MGVKMHVYADLWAHQGFVAARSPRSNDVKGLVVGYELRIIGPLEKRSQASQEGKVLLRKNSFALRPWERNSLPLISQVMYMSTYALSIKKVIQREQSRRIRCCLCFHGRAVQIVQRVRRWGERENTILSWRNRNQLFQGNERV